MTDYAGSDATTFLTALIDRLASRAGLDEDDVARKAMCQTLMELVDENAEAPLAALEGLTAERIGEIMERYVGYYVAERMLQVLGDRLEASNASETSMVQQAEAIEEFILFSTASLFQRIDPLAVDWDGAEGERIVRGLFEEAHGVLEAGK